MFIVTVLIVSDFEMHHKLFEGFDQCWYAILIFSFRLSRKKARSWSRSPWAIMPASTPALTLPSRPTLRLSVGSSTASVACDAIARPTWFRSLWTASSKGFSRKGTTCGSEVRITANIQKSRAASQPRRPNRRPKSSYLIRRTRTSRSRSAFSNRTRARSVDIRFTKRKASVSLNKMLFKATTTLTTENTRFRCKGKYHCTAGFLDRLSKRLGLVSFLVLLYHTSVFQFILCFNATQNACYDWGETLLKTLPGAQSLFRE